MIFPACVSFFFQVYNSFNVENTVARKVFVGFQLGAIDNFICRSNLNKLITSQFSICRTIGEMFGVKLVAFFVYYFHIFTCLHALAVFITDAVLGRQPAGNGKSAVVKKGFHSFGKNNMRVALIRIFFEPGCGELHFYISRNAVKYRNTVGSFVWSSIWAPYFID